MQISKHPKEEIDLSSLIRREPEAQRALEPQQDVKLSKSLPPDLSHTRPVSYSHTSLEETSLENLL